MLRVALHRVFLRLLFFGGAVAMPLAHTGCDRIFQSESARALEIAEKKEKAGDYKAAVQSYEAALEDAPKSADIHYRLALIYDDKLNSPISALHHFQRYLEISPKGTHAKDARNFISQNELKLSTSLAKGGVMSQSDAARLKNENLELRNQLVDARKQITDLRSLATRATMQTKGGKNVEIQQKAIPPGARTYKVEPGDTLASISRKYFKTSARWRDIQDANFNALDGTVKLKPGMTLVIPQK
jgi:nucleoid-associated protein YgaU